MGTRLFGIVMLLMPSVPDCPVTSKDILSCLADESTSTVKSDIWLAVMFPLVSIGKLPDC